MNEFEKLKEEVDASKIRKITPVNELLKMEEKKQPFLLEGMIVENSVNALTSDSGKGKSLVMLKMVEAIARGVKFLDQYETKKTNVLILDLEMSQNDLIQRAKSIVGEDIEGLDFHYCDSFDIENELDFKWLTDSIEERKYGLIVMDTLSAIHGKNENDNSEMNKINKKFLELTNQHNVTILFLHHHKKLQKGEKMNQATSRGASAIIDKSASQILIDSNDLTILLADKKPAQGLRMTLEQHKRRQLRGLDRFAVNIWNDPVTGKTTFEWAGKIAKTESALDKAKSIIVGLMDKGEEYIMVDFIEAVEGVGERIVREAVRELLDNVIDSRFPGETERQHNFRPIRKNTKIYFLK